MLPIGIVGMGYQRQPRKAKALMVDFLDRAAGLPAVPSPSRAMRWRAYADLAIRLTIGALLLLALTLWAR